VSSNATLIFILNNISIELNQYFEIFPFVFDYLGNVLNICGLSQRSLRSNQCTLLLLVSSISNLLAIFSGLTPRVLTAWNIDLTNIYVQPSICYEISPNNCPLQFYSKIKI